MTQTFSAKEAIIFGWHKLKSHSGLVFGVVLTMFALQLASSVVEKVLEDTVLGFAASLVFTVAGIVLGAGMTLVFLRLAKGEHTQYREIVPKAGLVWKYFCVSVITGVIAFLPVMAGGLISLVLLVSTGSINFADGDPTYVAEHLGALVAAAVIMAVSAVGAAYLSLRYSMAKLVTLEGGDIVESIRKSSKLTHGVKWRLVFFVLAILALNLLGFIALVVGLLVTIPVSMLAFSHVYLRLKGHHGHN
jgi:uncharacterized protein DUF975